MFHGSIVALVTPMDERGELDFDALKRLIEWHIENETDAFVLLGSTGESICLSDRERHEIVAAGMKYIDGRKPVIAGTGSASTAKTIELTKQAMHQGVDACLVVTPYYNRPPQEGLYRHYSALAEAVPLPLILYNVPTRTACDLLPETVARLAKVSNIIGIKDATGKPERLKEMQQCCGDKISYYSGDDASAVEFMLQGGRGVISVISNIVPKLMHLLCVAALRKEEAVARQINNQLKELTVLMGIESNPIPVKWALNSMKLIGPGLRSPLVPLSSQYHARLEAALRNMTLKSAICD